MAETSLHLLLRKDSMVEFISPSNIIFFYFWKCNFYLPRYNTMQLGQRIKKDCSRFEPEITMSEVPYSNWSLLEGPRLTVRLIHLKKFICLWVQNIQTYPLWKTTHHLSTSTKCRPKINTVNLTFWSIRNRPAYSLNFLLCYLQLFGFI